MDSRCRAKYGRAAACSVVLIMATGCSEAVKMEKESEHGGVVTYSFKQDRGGPMGSPYRKDALERIQTKCQNGSRLVREGEVRGYTSAGLGIEGTEDEERGRRWGIQFQCTPSDSGDAPRQKIP